MEGLIRLACGFRIYNRNLARGMTDDDEPIFDAPGLDYCRFQIGHREGVHLDFGRDHILKLTFDRDGRHGNQIPASRTKARPLAE